MTDRDASGKFVQGNKASPGRPPKEREEKYREIFNTTITFARFARIVDKLGQKAEKGDTQAAKILFDYLIGPPVQRNEHTGADGGQLVITISERNDKPGD